jgi:hypothetical protein
MESGFSTLNPVFHQQKFVHSFSNISKESHPLLRMLKIFKQFDNVHDPDMVSLVENRTQLANFTFPKGFLYPRKLLKNNSTKFVKYLGGIEMTVLTFHYHYISH